MLFICFTTEADPIVIWKEKNIVKNPTKVEKHATPPQVIVIEVQLSWEAKIIRLFSRFFFFCCLGC